MGHTQAALVSTVPAFTRSSYCCAGGGRRAAHADRLAGTGRATGAPGVRPGGTHLASVRSPNLPVSPDGRRRDLLVVRDLTTGTEQTVADHTSGHVYLGNVASPSWSADRQRIAYIEDDFGFSPTRYRWSSSYTRPTKVLGCAGRSFGRESSERSGWCWVASSADALGRGRH